MRPLLLLTLLLAGGLAPQQPSQCSGGGIVGAQAQITQNGDAYQVKCAAQRACVQLENACCHQL
jgi:hypothetical protein